MIPVIEAFATQIHIGSYFSSRTNRTPLKDDFYAIGALKKGKSTNADYEDDLLLFLGVESVSDVTFFSRLQIGEAVFHSREYIREFLEETITPLLTSRETVYVMGTLKHSFLSEIIQDWLVGLSLLLCQCLVSMYAKAMKVWEAQ